MPKAVKTTPWNKIKAEYLQGATPKELAGKYKLTAQQVSNKVKRDKWRLEKDQISHKTTENVQDRIKDLTHIALDALVEVINAPNCKNSEKIAAAKALLDVSGLKSVKQELDVKDVPIIIDNIK